MKRFYIGLFMSVLALSLMGQTSLDARINKHLGSKDFKYAGISITVLDLESGSVVAGVNEHKVMIPASSQKVLTTFTALDILGEDFTFKTELSYSGKIDTEGNLKGNIYIVGSGDPTLGSRKFDEILPFKDLLKRISKEIKRAGILNIEGNIIADESIFNSYPISPSWQWNDLGNYYAAGAWGININENQYSIFLNKRAKIGNRPKISGYGPKVPGLDLSNEITVDSSNTGDNAYIFGGPYNYKKRIVGTIPAGKGNFSIKGSIPDPPYFLAYHVFEQLRKDGISAESYEALYEPKKIKKNHIYTFESPPLRKIVRRANFESNNLYCESLLKTLATEEAKGGSGGLGIYILKKFLRKLKVKTESLHMEDGSGLSARNNINSMLLASFLRKYALKYDDMSSLTSLLPRAGATGTLSKMFRNSPAKGKVWAKSGSMDRVMSYTGFIKTKSGKWVSFAIITNGFSIKLKRMRVKLERIMTDIYKYG